MLSGLEEGWAALLDEAPDSGIANERGARLFAIAATLLECSDERLGDAGRLYAQGRATRLGLGPSPKHPERLPGLARYRFPQRLRPLTAFARLAARDLQKAPQIEPEATPARAAALLSHRLFGIVV